MKGFSQRIRQLREQHRLSKTALAKKIGVSTTCVWNWEEGNTEPRSENLRALSEVLSVTPEFLESGASRHGAKAPSAALKSNDVEQSLPEIIAEAKERIARMAGTTPEKVNISLDY